MKKNSLTPIVISSLLGAVLFIVPMAILAIWGDNEGIASSIASLLIIMAIGIVVELFAIFFTAKFVTRNNALAKGKIVYAEFVSCECKASNSTKDFYCVVYSVNIKGKDVKVQSPLVYSWEQALAFKYEKTFEVVVHKKNSYIVADADKLKVKHKKEIDEYKKSFYQAYNNYHNSKN